MEGDLDPAVSLIDEVEVTPEMLERVRSGQNLKIQDQVWILMQAVSKLLDLVEEFPEEYHTASIKTLLGDAISMMIIAAPAHERESLRKYITGETDGSELDGSEEEQPDEEVRDA